MPDTPSDKARITAADERYEIALHGMQAGVATELGRAEKEGAEDRVTTTKHLRVGINSAKVEHAALVEVLVKKGILTEVEYAEAMADAMEREHHRYEDHISLLLGTKVTLV